jgi:serine/threonine-protein kinase
MSTANSVSSGLDCASPESIMDPTNISPAGDQYSVGCVMYYCLTGRYPFPDGTAVEKMMAHQTKRPTPLAQLNPEVPAGLVAVVERLMAKKPEDRYPDAAAAADALREFAAQKGSERGKRGPDSGRHPPVPPKNSGKRPVIGARETLPGASCPTPLAPARVPGLSKQAPTVAPMLPAALAPIPHLSNTALPTRQSVLGPGQHQSKQMSRQVPTAPRRPVPPSPNGNRGGISSLGLFMLAVLVGVLVWLLGRTFLF